MFHHPHHRSEWRRRFAHGEGRRGCGPEGGPEGGPGHEHGHHRHGRGGRRSARLFDHGELRLVVLALIADQPRHGYELIKAIEERAGGSYSPSPGVIYPTLTMLEELGQATVEESGGKKLYAATDEGRVWLAANRGAVDAALARMDEVGAGQGGRPAPQLVRAMENLKLALRLRLRGGSLSDEQLRQIVETLDAAAVAIERS
ncbi:transcriptional regulator, PadR family [Tistlia consotensis]|uniref:Transcriptional regulator, PadR family n=1 Tax=Tistlia consotensis USBA 355 TaxID=560819 RepID=A0A1Y6BH06_9PROT|nr:PadR family transcriptional regulator [Tistlia consotensis]SMF07222.1 transcriptional regulator, PadR family [Tistlia consotensis USBA 355]SNR36012.1 transcriptional regulator, PadR family [Tistlia consotensis]